MEIDSPKSPVCVCVRTRACMYGGINFELLAACSSYCKPILQCPPSRSRTFWSTGVSVDRKSNEIWLKATRKPMKMWAVWHLPTKFWDRPVALVPFAGIDPGNRWILGLNFCVRGVAPVLCWYARAVQRMTWSLAQAVANFRLKFDRLVLDRAVEWDKHRWPFQ